MRERNSRELCIPPHDPTARPKPDRSRSILVVDDEPTILESTADLLRAEGYECDCAPDSRGAADLLSRTRYDLIIADIKMPGNTDLELIEALPELAKGVPAILQTGYPSLSTAIRSLELSVVAYLIKPVDFDQLLEAVVRGVKLSSTARTLESSKARIQASLEHISSLQDSLTENRGNSHTLPLQSFVDLTLVNILGGLEDLSRLTDTGTIGCSANLSAELAEREKLQTAREALVDAVETLERTRNAFKSKTIGALRGRLEGILTALS